MAGRWIPRYFYVIKQDTAHIAMAERYRRYLV